MSKSEESTIAALRKERPRRGRPRRAVSRKNVYVTLTQGQRQQMQMMVRNLPEGFGRADIPDMAVRLLARRMERLQSAVADRSREIPEGITDLDSLYLLWDLPLPADTGESKWTSIRLSPQQVIELGRTHGVLNALFGANRSEVFGLGLSLLAQYLEAKVVGDLLQEGMSEEATDLIAQN